MRRVQGQLTLGQRCQVFALPHIEVLEAGQLPEAFGQQTGEQLVRTCVMVNGVTVPSGRVVIKLPARLSLRREGIVLRIA